MQRLVTDNDVNILAKDVVEWEKLFDVFNLNDVTKEYIKQHQPDIDKHRIFLRAWKNEKGPEATFANLHQSALSAGDEAFAYVVNLYGMFAGCSTAGIHSS